MSEAITWVGLDAHKSSVSVSAFLPGLKQPVEWQVVNEPDAIRRMVRKVERQAPGEVRFCYEAGPCGYRDARKLGELFRAGLLTEVHPPAEADESARDLCRARDDARQDLMRSRHRLTKLLLRRGISIGIGQKAWTQRYRVWLRGLRFEQSYDQIVFDDYLLAIDQVEERLRSLEAGIERLSQAPEYAPAVGALRCFRGIDTLTATVLVTELHSFGRFTSPRGLMAFLGLVPSEYSSSDSRRLGSITKTGNGHVRRLLIEAAWHYRHRPSLATLRKRRVGQPAQAIAIADRALHRLNRRFNRMAAKGIPSAKIAVAVARELTGFVWAALQPTAA